MKHNIQSPFSTRQKMINILYIVLIALLFIDESGDLALSSPDTKNDEQHINELPSDGLTTYSHSDSKVDSGIKSMQPATAKKITEHKPFVRLEQPKAFVFTGIQNIFNLHLSDVDIRELSFESDNATIELSDSGVLITPLKTMEQFSIDIKKGKTMLDRYSFQAKELPPPDILCLVLADSSITQCRMHDQIFRSLLLESRSIQFSNSMFPHVTYQLSEFSVLQRDVLGNATKQVIRPLQESCDFKSIAHLLRREKTLLLTDIRLVVNNSYEQTLSSFRLTLQ